jgi:hypothetical protein
MNGLLWAISPLRVRKIKWWNGINRLTDGTGGVMTTNEITRLSSDLVEDDADLEVTQQNDEQTPSMSAKWIVVGIVVLVVAVPLFMVLFGFAKIFGGVAEVATKLLEILGSVIDFVWDAIKAVGGWIKDFCKWAWDLIKRGALWVWRGIKTTCSAIYDAGAWVVTTIGNALEAIYNNTIGRIADLF